MKKGFAHILIILGVLVVGAVALMFLLPRSTNKTTEETLTPSPTQTSNPTADWRTYTNQYGFLVKYPTDWKVIKSSDFELLIASSDKDIKISNVIVPAKNQIAIYFGFIHSALENYADGKSDIRPDPNSNGTLIKWGRLLGGKGSFGILTYYWKDDPNIDAYEKIYDQILSTFKFTRDCSADAECGQDICNQALPTTCYSYKCVNNKCVTDSKTYGQ